MGWGGGQPAVGLAGQPPAALMDGPMVGPVHQGQVGQVGGVAVQPGPQVVGVAPGRGPLAVGDHPAAVAAGQGGALAGWTTRPADVQRLAGRPPRTGASGAIAARSRAARPSSMPWVAVADLSLSVRSLWPLG